MMSKGQIAGQVFIYAMGLIIIGIVIVFGYIAIQDFIERSDQLSFVDFKTRLTTTIDDMTSEYGSVKHRTFQLPKGYSKICFLNVDPSIDPANLDAQFICVNSHVEHDPLICNYLKSQTDNVVLTGQKVNTFYIGDDESSFQVRDHTTVELDHYFCPEIKSGSFTIKVTGKGKYAEIGEPT